MPEEAGVPEEAVHAMWSSMSLWVNGIAAWLTYRLARDRDEFTPQQIKRLGPALAVVKAEARTARRQATVLTVGYVAAAILGMFHGFAGCGLFFALSSARCWGLAYCARRYPSAVDLGPNNAAQSETFWNGAGAVLATMSGLFLWGILR